ncbi:peptidoglycan-binding protein [Ancrocorticia sp.]|uniref:peptidoglycan-binding protein n=1 Tax=Ancrocorticia sp. TaxID=2593684 RepID=UPI003F8E8A56
MKRRFLWIGVTVVTCLALVAGAFAVGRFVRSPNEEAIENSQAKAVITAQVEDRTLPPDEIQSKGVLTLGKSWDVTVEPSDGSLPVVTAKYASAGDTLHSGGVLAEVSGRPVMGLALPFDLYRDIYVGDSGSDVREIQRALRDLGLYGGGIDGEYGPATAAAVKALYTRAGVAAPAPVAEASDDEGAGGEAGGSADSDKKESESGAATGEGGAAGGPAGGTSVVRTEPAKSYVPVMRSEFVTLTSGSATVVKVAGVNTQVSADTPLAKLRSGGASATVRIGVGDKDSFKTGADVTVQAASDNQMSTTGRVANVGEFAQAKPDEGKDIPGYDVTVEVADPKELTDDQEIVVVVEGGDAVSGPAVPVTALREDGPDMFVVLSGSNKHVPVTVTQISEGYAVLKDPDLSVGDEIIVSD